jgi:hypothetical protein
MSIGYASNGRLYVLVTVEDERGEFIVSMPAEEFWEHVETLKEIHKRMPKVAPWIEGKEGQN